MSSARWQVLGTIDSDALPVAQIARNMGLARQAVQRVANELSHDGLVTFVDNPNHRRAKLVRLTARGRTALDRATALQVEWANGMAEDELARALATLRALTQRLDG